MLEKIGFSRKSFRKSKKQSFLSSLGAVEDCKTGGRKAKKSEGNAL